MHEAFTDGIVCACVNGEYQDPPQGEGPGDEAILTYDDGSDESSPFVTMQELQEHTSTYTVLLGFGYFSHTKYICEDSFKHLPFLIL